jgi:hypothetical protein
LKVPHKQGCRTLNQQLRDYTIIALILFSTAMLGRFFQQQKELAGGGEHAEEHAEEHAVVQVAQVAVSQMAQAVQVAVTQVTQAPVTQAPTLPQPAAAIVRRRMSGHHAVDPNLDMQATLGICVVLISVAILFETLKHKMEHDVPPMMQGVLQAMFV